MILDRIIELENKVIKNKKRLPSIVRLNYQSYVCLTKEIDANLYLSEIHGMCIEIQPIKNIIVE